eukprot:COSAG01_NODE_696_length_14189_cov_31.024769_12_plen_100_part_00
MRSALALLLGGPRAALGALGSVCRGVAASLAHAAALLHPLTRLVSGLVVRFGGFVSGCVSASPSLSLSLSLSVSTLLSMRAPPLLKCRIVGKSQPVIIL